MNKKTDFYNSVIEKQQGQIAITKRMLATQKERLRALENLKDEHIMRSKKGIDNPNTLTLIDIFSCTDIEKACDLEGDIDEIVAQVIEPNLQSINELTGQENDARYLAYSLVNVIDNGLNLNDFNGS